MATNGTLVLGIGLDVRRLTFDNLSSIPRRNNILFLSDYLQEQQSYAKRYASEGLTMFSGRNHTASPSPKTPAEASVALDEFLLQTPMLKARAPPTPVIIERPSTILKALTFTCGPTPISDDQASPKSTTGNTTRTKKLPRPNAPRSAQDNLTEVNVGKKNSVGRKETPKENKKRTENECSNEEHLSRLQERRERKRFKKNIMKSFANENNSEKENPARYTKKKGNQKGKTKSQSFALMHGFTATNVGKSRITLEPLLRNVGVFQKGKASCALKTGKIITKKRSAHDVFSEAQFLEIAKIKSVKNDFNSSSASSSSSGKVHERKITVKRKGKLTVFKKNKQIDEIAREPVEDSNCGDNADRKESPALEEDRRSYDPANSITWDIERESCVEESEGNCGQGTISLGFPLDVLARVEDKEKGQDTIAETPAVRAEVAPGNLADATFIETSDDSLHPSQSASQVVRKHPNALGIGNHEQLTFSKYFVPKNGTTKEADGHKQQGLYGGRRSITLHQEEKPNLNRCLFHQPPPRIEAHSTSSTLSQMISLDLVDELPPSYDAFALADVRSIFEDTTMEVDDYGPFLGPDVPQEADFWSRSDNERIAFEPGLHAMQHHMLENPDFSFVSGNFMEHDFGFKDPPVFQAEDSRDFPHESCHQNLQMRFALEEELDGIPLSNWNVDNCGSFNAAGYEAASINDTFSRIAPSDLPIVSVPSVDGSSEDDICVGPSPTKIDHFSQGRSLLYGLDHGNTRVSNAEAEVAKLLKQNHWLPHRL